jgi:hypothetical protein
MPIIVSVRLFIAKFVLQLPIIASVGLYVTVFVVYILKLLLAIIF